LFPSAWHQSVVIPIPKPGKDTENPNNYRPIALTSCLSKTLERIINNRLMWCLEKISYCLPFKMVSGKNKNTIDHLVRFESYLKEAAVKNLHTVAIFF